MKKLIYLFCLVSTISCIPNGGNPVPTEVYLTGLIDDSVQMSNTPALDTLTPINFNELQRQNNNLPISYLLSMPTPKLQNGNTCVGWAIGYAAMSYSLRYSSKENYFSNNIVNNSRVFSASYIFNKLYSTGQADTGGVRLLPALNFVKDNGCEILESFPITTNYSVLPSTSNDLNASKYKVPDYKSYYFSIEHFKEIIANDFPIIIAINVGDSIKNVKNVSDNFVYNYFNKDRDKSRHAVVICGYDDNKNAFKITNSWGTNWGNGGYLWINYNILRDLLIPHTFHTSTPMYWSGYAIYGKGFVLKRYQANSGLSAFYPFNNDVKDESIENNNATNFGATLTTDRFNRANSAYLFNGTNYIRIPANSAINLNNNYSVSLWYNQTGSSCTGSFCYSGILSKYQPTNSNTCFEIEAREEGSCTSTSANINYLHYTPPSQVPTNIDMITYGCSNYNTWHHIVVTKENATTKLYLDGVLKSVVTNSNYTNSNNDGYIEIGRQYYKDLSNNFHNFKGKIDDIRIYQRVLSASEVQQLNN